MPGSPTASPGANRVLEVHSYGAFRSEGRLPQMTRHRGWLAALAALALIAVGSGCGSNSSSKPGSSGVLKIGAVGGVDSLNPFNLVNLDSYTAQQYVYPFLVQFDAQLKPAPYFGKSWTFSPDGRTLTFHTVAGAKWSDGRPLTAADAAFTINTIVHYQTGATALLGTQVAGIESVTATDPNTLVIRYKEPSAAALSNLQQIPILPEHVWKRFATGKGDALKSHQAAPPDGVYGGPFVVTKWKKDAATLFARNPHWWGDQQPSISGWGIEVFGNPDAMMTALNQGEIDLAEAVPATAASAAVKNDNLVVSQAPPGGLILALWANANPKKKDHRELLDPNVREALTLAVDRDQINRVAFLGYARPAGSVIPPSLPGAVSLPVPPLDPQKANQLLDKAGFRRGSDGVRVAFGKPMSYPVVVIQGSGSEDRIFNILKKSLAAIGIKVTELSQSGSAAIATLAGSDGKVTSYDMALATNAPVVDPDFELSQFLCSVIGTQNFSGYCNPKFDALYAQEGKIIDPAKRNAIIGQMQRLVYADNGWIPLNYESIVSAWRKPWTGFVPSVAGPLNAYSVATLLSVHRG